MVKPAGIRGDLVIPAGQDSAEILDETINQHTVFQSWPQNPTATRTQLFGYAEAGKINLRTATDADGYAQADKDEHILNMSTDVPIKIVNYDRFSHNPRIPIDNPNGLFTTIYDGIYSVSSSISFLAPNNSAFTLYIARNDDPGDALSESGSISGGAQNLELSFDLVTDIWKGGNTMSLWFERNTGSGNVTIYAVGMSVIQDVALESMPPLFDCRYRYICF